MVTSSCPPVVDVTIMRPDLKFQLGFSVKDGNVSSIGKPVNMNTNIHQILSTCPLNFISLLFSLLDLFSLAWINS